MAVKAKQESSEIVIEQLKMGSVNVWVKGLSPLIYNAMSEKARQELLYPKGRKTSADKQGNLKHNPIEEYRNSVYRSLNGGPTRLVFPSSAFKGAMAQAALDLPGAKKAQIGRLVWVEGDKVPLYGVPKMMMSITRSSDMNHTPDVRTRAIIPEWAAPVSIKFMKPNLNETMVGRLLEAGGILSGVGDFRQGKGKGNYGQFQICQEDDIKNIIKNGSMSAQDAALTKPEFYDQDTEATYSWFENERKLRGN
jgi:hypothetical protein